MALNDKKSMKEIKTLSKLLKDDLIIELNVSIILRILSTTNF